MDLILWFPGGSIIVGSSLRPTYVGSKNVSTPAMCSGVGGGEMGVLMTVHGHSLRTIDGMGGRT